MIAKDEAVESDQARLALVGDFGGTHVRLALADLRGEIPSIRNVRHFLAKDFRRAADAITSYMSGSPDIPSIAVIAAAGPVNDGVVSFTNLGWTLTERELKHMGFAAMRIVNDFAAAALATQLLGVADVHQVGTGTTDRRRNAAVMGPGTGFGAAALVVASDGVAVPMAAEAGHASLAPDDDVEVEVLRFLRHRYAHVSIERILSGPGISDLHEALNAIDGVADANVEAEEITQRALAGESACLRTVQRFCAILGGVAGNLALTYGAQGGVYIAGGIAPNILPVLDRSAFRSRFESKGRFAEYLRPIATHVIIRTDAAFLGAAQAARMLTRRRERISSRLNDGPLGFRR
ncbi:MAG TPA: glucokinase [Rhizomicrobium sp.]